MYMVNYKIFGAAVQQEAILLAADNCRHC
jgi:hypothetical protein